MCPNCKHQLTAKDLIPLFSWLSLGGKCRYCHKSISWQYPAVELVTAILFVVSYTYWPYELMGLQIISFITWLILLTGFIALAVYDIRWMLLPNRIIYPLYGVGFIYALTRLVQEFSYTAIIDLLSAVAIAGGLFYIIFQLSKGMWIGGGDVKLGFLLGLVLLTAGQAFLMLFLASLLGVIYSMCVLLVNKSKYQAKIPFGPFLLIASFVVVLWGANVINWYTDYLLFS